MKRKGGYHFLRHKDLIREGDEYKGYDPDCTKLMWIKITKPEYNNMIGTRRTKGMVAIRRKK